MSGPPVTLVGKGGFPIIAVTDGAPLARVVAKGGVPVMLATSGVPMVLGDMAPPGELTAPVLALLNGTTDYPPQFRITFDASVQTGDSLFLQWANVGQPVDEDGNFTAINGGNVHVITSGENAIKRVDITLTSITSRTFSYQVCAIHNGQRSPPSNIVNHGP